ncbi:tetratricopeptide repeat protein [bacterium]|nr:tetratricopeptide repeat protein [bacterium]
MDDIKPKNLIENTPEKYLLLFIIFITIAIYLPRFWGTFILYDTPQMVLRNPAVEHPLKGIVELFRVKPGITYQPIRDLSYRFDFLLWGTSFTGLFAHNLFLYILNIIALFYLVKLLFKDKTIAFITTLVFAVHPLHVESVAWIAARKDPLSGLFFVLSMLLFIKGLDRNSIKYILASFLVYILALLSKATTLCLPFVLLLLSFFRYFKTQQFKKSLLFQVPFWLVNVFGAVMLYFAVGSIKMKYEWDNIFISALNIAKIFKDYVIKLVIPYRLSHTYLVEISLLLREPSVIFALILSACLLGLIIYGLVKKKPKIWFTALLFIACYLPVSNIVPLLIQADRYMYLPLIAYSLSLGLLLTWMIQRRKNIVIVLIIVVFVLIGLSFRRVVQWKNTETLCIDSLKSKRASPSLWYQMATYYSREGMRQKAKQAAQESIKEMSWFYLPYFMLGYFAEDEGQYNQAVKYFRTLVEMKQDIDESAGSVVRLYCKMGRIEKAGEFYPMITDGSREHLLARIWLSMGDNRYDTPSIFETIRGRDDLTNNDLKIILEYLLNKERIGDAIEWVTSLENNDLEFTIFRKKHINGEQIEKSTELGVFKESIKVDLNDGMFGLAMDKNRFLRYFDSSYLEGYLGALKGFLDKGQYFEALLLMEKEKIETYQDDWYFTLASIYDSLYVYDDSAAKYYRMVSKQTNEPEVRVKCLDRLEILDRREPLPQQYYAVAMEFYKGEYYEKALPIYLQMVHIFGEQPNLLNILGNTYINLDMPEQAIVAWERALVLEPDLVDATFNLGLAYSRLNNEEKAAWYFQKFLMITSETDLRIDYVKRWLLRFR